VLERLRENQAAPPESLLGCKQVVLGAPQYLKILDPKRGDKELIKAVAVVVAKLSRE
jgi:hypothetical protein